MSDACVVDASVGIKLFIEEEFSPEVDRLFNGLTASPPAHFYVPDLFYVECANILWKYTRRFDYPAGNARQDVRDLRALALRTVSTADLLEPALELALAYDMTVYDASYAALAQQLNLPLITADQALQRKLSGSQIPVHTLADLALLRQRGIAYLDYSEDELADEFAAVEKMEGKKTNEKTTE